MGWATTEHFGSFWSSSSGTSHTDLHGSESFLKMLEKTRLMELTMRVSHWQSPE